MGDWIDKVSAVNTRVSLVGTAHKGGALIAYIAPLIGGLSQWKVIAAAGWDGRLLLVGIAGSLFGAALNQGAGWVLAQGRERLDRQHSNRITAALRAVRQARGKADELRSVQEQLLRCIAETARATAGRPETEVVACLLLPRSDKLVVTAYSGFRNNSVPSAEIPLDEPEGASRAYREGRVVVAPDVHDGPHRERFAGKPYRSLLAFPMVVDGACIGIMAVDSTTSKHFREDNDEVVVHLHPFVEVLKETIPHRAAREALHAVQ